MRIPNPLAIPIPSTLPPTFAPALTSQTRPARPGARTIYPIHEHCAFVSGKGEGTTTVVASHFHRILNGRILPDASDGHTHDFTGFSCGAGAGNPNLG